MIKNKKDTVGGRWHPQVHFEWKWLFSWCTALHHCCCMSPICCLLCVQCGHTVIRTQQSTFFLDFTFASVLSYFGTHACAQAIWNVSSQQGRGHSRTLRLISSADVALFSLNTPTFVDQSILVFLKLPVLVSSCWNYHTHQPFCAFFHFKHSQ